MEDPQPKDGKIDLVPMIDCIMLLLMFFILTTSFTSPEKALAALLPTNVGPGPGRMNQAPQTISITAWPADLPADESPSYYAQALAHHAAQGQWFPAARIRVGGAEPLEIDGLRLDATQDGQAQQIAAIHTYIAEQLRLREVDGQRQAQTPVIIECFSRLRWKYAAAIYDAVRAYEAGLTPPTHADEKVSPAEALHEARSVTFAAPQLHGGELSQQAQELWEITHRR